MKPEAGCEAISVIALHANTYSKSTHARFAKRFNDVVLPKRINAINQRERSRLRQRVERRSSEMRNNENLARGPLHRREKCGAATLQSDSRASLRSGLRCAELFNR